MLALIKDSVGRGGKNHKPDVWIVQFMLNRCGLELPQGLKEDGACGGKTIGAVVAFQRLHCKVVDGRIDPNGATLSKLLQRVKATLVGNLRSIPVLGVSPLWLPMLLKLVQYLKSVDTKASASGEAGNLRGNAEFRLLVATVYGEAANSSETAWKSVAYVMKNRVGKREWTRYKSVSDIIKNTGFDAHTQRNGPYVTAEKYLQENGAQAGKNARIERMIEVLTPVYLGSEADVTGGAVLYYSPKAQAALHKTNPKMWPAGAVLRGGQGAARRQMQQEQRLQRRRCGLRQGAAG